MKQIFFAVILALVFSVLTFAQSEKSPCPEIDVSIDANELFNLTEPMLFSVKVGDEAKNLSLEYAWTVTQGKIIEGQGTPSIKVDIAGLNDLNITATVEIKGLPKNCAKIASETGSVVIDYRAKLFNEYGKLSANKIREHLKSLYVELGNNSKFKGYIINYGTDTEIAIREKQIRKARNFLKYDASRITIVNGGSNPNGTGVWTKVWIVPPGADNPQP